MASGDKNPVLMQSDIGVPGGVVPTGHVTEYFTIATKEDIANAIMGAYAATEDFKVGFYVLSITAKDLPSNFLGQGTWNMTVYRTDKDYGRIDLMAYDANVTLTARYIMYSNDGNAGRLSELMWDNPPMIPGVVYCTTECYGGKPVYCVALTGTSATGLNSIKLPETVGNGQLVSATGQVGDYPIPTYTEESGQRVDYYDWVHGYVSFKCTSAFGGLPYRIVVKYTKEKANEEN